MQSKIAKDPIREIGLKREPNNRDEANDHHPDQLR